MQRKLPLDAFSRHDPTNGEHLAGAAARAADHRACENLNSLVLAFENPRVHIDGVADGEFGRLALEARFLYELENVLAHRLVLFITRFVFCAVEQIGSPLTCA